MRRLPVYLLIDCSESMVGDAITSVQSGLKILVDTLRSDPHALETAYVSIIAFSGEAKQILPLTELTEVRLPQLPIGAGTSLGKALSLLSNCIEGEVRRTTAQVKGDYRPLVFLLTDGQPTDDWQAVKQSIDRLTKPRVANFYAIGCGEDIDFDMLLEVADHAFRLDELDPAKLKKLFIWLTASVQNASAAVECTNDYKGIDFSKKPSEIEEVKRGSHRSYSGPPIQVFLKAMCTSKKMPYLMRYRLDKELGVYFPVKSHTLEKSMMSRGSFDVPSINASQLAGPAPCPYCQNQCAGVCGCGAIMCLPEGRVDSVVCPACGEGMHLSDSGGDFTIQQSAG